jgi:hypothetical protein
MEHIPIPTILLPTLSDVPTLREVTTLAEDPK